MFPHLRRLILPLVLASLPLQAETLQYSVPPFQTRAWHPPTTVTVTTPEGWDWVWRQGALTTRTIDPAPYWIAPTYKTITWEAEFRTDTFPAEIGERWVEEVRELRPYTYTVVIPERGHTEIVPGTPESTGTRTIDRTGVRDVWRDTSYEDWVFLDDWDDEGNYWWWYGLVWFEDGYWDVESYSYTETETYTIPGTPDTTRWVVDEAEHAEERIGYTDHVILGAHMEYFEVTPARTVTTLVRAAGSASVVDVEGRWQDDPPYTVEEREPDYQVWAIVEFGSESTREAAGFWEDVTVPETTLTVNTDDISNITSLLWSAHGYKHGGTFDVEVASIQVPFCADRLLVEQNWIAEDNGDDDTVWNESLIFWARARVLPASPGVPTPVTTPSGQVWRGPDGRWRVRDLIEPVGLIEALAQVDVYIMDVAIKLREKRGEVWSYLTYEKFSLTDPLIRIYAGKTWGAGEPHAVQAVREANHYWQRQDLGPGIINSAMVTRKIEQAAQFSMRGREQSIIDWHDRSGQAVIPHTSPTNLSPGLRLYFYDPTPTYPSNYSHSDNLRPSPQTNHPHGTRAVRKDKEDGKKYWEYSTVYFGYLWEFTGDPLADLGTFGIIEPIRSLVSQFVRPPLNWSPQ